MEVNLRDIADILNEFPMVFDYWKELSFELGIKYSEVKDIELKNETSRLRLITVLQSACAGYPIKILHLKNALLRLGYEGPCESLSRYPEQCKISAKVSRNLENPGSIQQPMQALTIDEIIPKGGNRSRIFCRTQQNNLKYLDLFVSNQESSTPNNLFQYDQSVSVLLQQLGYRNVASADEIGDVEEFEAFTEAWKTKIFKTRARNCLIILSEKEGCSPSIGQHHNQLERYSKGFSQWASPRKNGTEISTPITFLVQGEIDKSFDILEFFAAVKNPGIAFSHVLTAVMECPTEGRKTLKCLCETPGSDQYKLQLRHLLEKATLEHQHLLVQRQGDGTSRVCLKYFGYFTNPEFCKI